MSSSNEYIMGAVAYDPKVVTIWDGFRTFLGAQGFPFDYVLFSNYERQVAALLEGRIHAAWNSPLAWIEARELARKRGAEARAIAMRDTDQDLTSVVVARDDSGVRSLADLRGKRVAVGASDSPQGTLIPLLLLWDAGLDPGRDVEILRFEVGVGLHGDHVGGERDAARALADGRCDAACMLDANHLAFTREGTLRAAGTRVLAQTPAFDHCNMSVIGGTRNADAEHFAGLLLAMSWEDPKVRALLDLEGLRAWRPGRTSGYSQLDRAVAKGGTLTGFLEQVEDCA